MLDDDITFLGLTGWIEHRTPTSATFSLHSPDEGRGEPRVGSLDIHFPCEDRGFVCATLAVDESFPLSTTPRDFSVLLLSQLGLPSDTLWDVRIWRIESGQTDNNDPRVFRR